MKDERKAIHDVLKRLESKGRLTPDAVIEEARKPDSPLHSEFTWDVKEAAMTTWRHQARIIISSFHVSLTVNRKTYQIQEFVESTAKVGKEQGYVAFSNIKSSKQLASEFLERELAVASTYVCKTKDYAEVLGLRARVEGLVGEIESLRADAAGAASRRKAVAA